MRLFLTRLRKALWGLYEDGSLGFAKGAAYSALLAFFPVLTTLSAWLIQANAEAVSRKIANFLFRVVPPGAEEFLKYTMTQRGAQPLTLPIAASILALWAATGVIISLLEGFQAAYKKTDQRGAVTKRLVAIGLIFICLLPVLGASSLLIFGDQVERAVLTKLKILEAGQALEGSVHVIGRLVRSTISLCTTVLVTGLLFKLGPSPQPKMRTVWRGAMLSTALWWLSTLGFAWYVRHVANYNVLYGSIGAAIALLVWMYLLAVIALLGCEYNAAMPDNRGR
jgi:membrane protein